MYAVRMATEFDYSKKRFAVALKVLTTGDPSLLRGPDTLAARLRAAVLEVHSCTRRHFARNSDYVGFAAVMNSLRGRAQSGTVLDGLHGLPSADCTRYVSRLVVLAQSVVTAAALIRLPRGLRLVDISDALSAMC